VRESRRRLRSEGRGTGRSGSVVWEVVEGFVVRFRFRFVHKIVLLGCAREVYYGLAVPGGKKSQLLKDEASRVRRLARASKKKRARRLT